VVTGGDRQVFIFESTLLCCSCRLGPGNYEDMWPSECLELKYTTAADDLAL
jgi:hypothetical protein